MTKSDRLLVIRPRITTQSSLDDCLTPPRAGIGDACR